MQNSILPTISSTDDNSLPTTTVSYEDIGPSVANKILPSVVGIEVEYTVNSIFGGKGTSNWFWLWYYYFF